MKEYIGRHIYTAHKTLKGRIRSISGRSGRGKYVRCYIVRWENGHTTKPKIEDVKEVNGELFVVL